MDLTQIELFMKDMILYRDMNEYRGLEEAGWELVPKDDTIIDSFIKGSKPVEAVIEEHIQRLRHLVAKDGLYDETCLDIAGADMYLFTSLQYCRDKKQWETYKEIYDLGQTLLIGIQASDSRQLLLRTGAMVEQALKRFRDIRPMDIALEDSLQ